jgi:hypothetical protein
MTPQQKSMTLLDAIDRCSDDTEGDRGTGETFDGAITIEELRRQFLHWSDLADRKWWLHCWGDDDVHLWMKSVNNALWYTSSPASHVPWNPPLSNGMIQQLQIWSEHIGTKEDQSIFYQCKPYHKFIGWNVLLKIRTVFAVAIERRVFHEIQR